jgi:hypothetical protein
MYAISIPPFGVHKKQFVGMSKRGKAIQVTDVKYREIFVLLQNV